MKLQKIVAGGADGLYREQKTQIIYFRQYRKDRGELKRSLKTKDLKAAKRLRDEIRARFTQKSAIAKQEKTALELFDLWVARKESLKKSPATITSIKATRKFLAPHLESMLPEEITAEWWESVYIGEVRSFTENPNRKFFNDRKWLLSFLKSLQEDGKLAKAPKLVNPDPKESVGKVYSDEDVALLLNFAQNPDLHLAILMAATMGMRRGEIFELRADRIDIKKQLIRLKKEDTKTRKARTFAISQACWPELKIRAQRGSLWVFPSKEHKNKPLHKDGFYTAWDNLKTTCGIEGRFHDLRHTFLTKAFNAPGANPAQICSYAGLSLEVAERVYLHLTEEDSRQVAGLVKYE